MLKLVCEIALNQDEAIDQEELSARLNELVGEFQEALSAEGATEQGDKFQMQTIQLDEGSSYLAQA
jgi:hypothetical protein